MEHNQVQPNNIQTAGTIDIRQLISRYFSRWPVFLLCGVIAFGMSYVYLKFQKPVYQVKSRLLIKEKMNYDDPSQMIFGRLGMRNSKDLPNQQVILRSYPIIAQAVERTGLNVSYFRENRFISKELYKSAPFTVEIVDSIAGDGVATTQFFWVRSMDSEGFVLETEQPRTGFVPGRYQYGDVIALGKTNIRVKKRKGVENRSGEYAPFQYEYRFRIITTHDLTRSYKSKVQVMETPASSILEVSMRDNIRQRAKDFLGQLLHSFSEASLAEKNKVVDSTVAFIDKEILSITDSLFVQEDELEDFQTSLKVPDLTMQGELLLKEFAQLEAQKDEAKLRSKYYDYMNTKLQNDEDDYDKFMAPVAFGVTDPVLSKLVTDIISLQIQKNTLLEGGASKVSKIDEIDGQLEEYKTIMVRSIADLKASNQIAMEDVKSKLILVENDAKKLPSSERQMLKLKRLLSLNEGIYLFLKEKRANVLITRSANTPDCKIIEPPYLEPRGPIAPNKKVIRIIWFLVGLFVPLGIMVVYDSLNDKLKSKEELQSITNIPVLGSIPHFSKLSKHIGVAEFPKSSLAEAFRIVRTNLEFFGETKSGKMILITSSIAGEGKTFCAINLAGILAMSGNKTVLVGLDLRKPQIHNYLGFNNDKGVTTYLTGKNTIDDIKVSSEIENLTILPSGPIPPNPAELLLRDKATEMLSALRKEYDYVILDTTPSQLVSDAQVLMKHVDASIFIVRQGKTTRDLVQNINQTHANGKYENITTILNDVPRGKTYGYGYGYGYYEETELGLWGKITKRFRGNS